MNRDRQPARPAPSPAASRTRVVAGNTVYLGGRCEVRGIVGETLVEQFDVAAGEPGDGAAGGRW